MAEASKSHNPICCKLTQERVRELLHYDPETGLFTWRVNLFCGQRQTRPLVRIDDPAGCLSRVYTTIKFEGVTYYAHSLAWLYVHGDYLSVDHCDCDGHNNKLANLRRCTASQNQANKRRQINNTSGFKGVSRKSGRFVANIKFKRKQIHLGYHDTPEAAHEAYRRKAIELFGEFARGA